MRHEHTNKNQLKCKRRDSISEGVAHHGGGKQLSANTQLAPRCGDCSPTGCPADRITRLPVICAVCNVPCANDFGGWPIEGSPSHRQVPASGPLRHAMCFPIDSSEGG